MTARILVVDDLLPNVKLLEARLGAEYYEVVSAYNGPDAIEICKRGACDLVLLDVMMPGMDGFEVCRRLKADPCTSHLPIVMLTALDTPSDRVRGLDCGADDFLTKPFDEAELIARVRSLSRLKVTIDELRLNAQASASLGGADPIGAATAADGEKGRILVVEDRPGAADRIVQRLRGLHLVEIVSEPQAALLRAADEEFDLLVVGLGLASFDALRLVAQVRALERTRSLPILLTAEREDKARILRGLELGANDYLARPIDGNELVARVRTQVRRHRYNERLRQSMQNAIEMAGVDALTGLHNRRYFENQFGSMMERAAEKGRHLSLLVLDIDHFKSVNDTFGHDAGDVVLRAFAARIRRVVPDGRSRLPAGRRGIRGGDARHAGRDGGARRRTDAPQHRGRAVPTGNGWAEHPRDDVGGARRARRRARAGRTLPRGRSGALRRQTRRTQPRHRCCGLTA